VKAQNESPSESDHLSRRRRSAPLALILALAALLAVPAFAGAAQTLKVNGATGADSGNCVVSACATIGYSIGQSTAGDKIEVAAGHYEEKLTINKELTLEGAPGGGTEIGPLGTSVVVAGSLITLEPGTDGTELKNLGLHSAAQAQPTIATTGGRIDDVTVRGVHQVGLGPSHVPSTIASGLALSVPTDGWVVANSSFDSDYMGIQVGNDTTNLAVVGSSFTRDRNGFYVERKEPTAGNFIGEVDGLTMVDDEFIENQYRGMYFEGLSNAEIIGATVRLAGATAPSHPFGARGISFNLKAGNYENIKVVAAEVAESENEGISVQVRGSAEDSATYKLHPATLNQIEITESTVVDNDGPGIVVENSTQLGTTTISDSRILGNARNGIPTGDTASGIDAWDERDGAPTVDAADNWFGCNAGPTAAGSGCDTVNGSVDAGPWLVLTATPEASVLAPGAATGIRAAIDSDSDGGAGGRLPVGPEVPIAFAATGGTVSPQGTALVGGEALATFTAGAEGDAAVTATVDNQTVAVPLAVKKPAEEPRHEEPTPVATPPNPAPAPPPTPAPAAKPVTIEPTESKAPPAVPSSGSVTVATVECASSSCQVEAKNPTITIGGQNYKIKVKVPDTVAGGTSAPVKVILPKKVREALEESGKGKVRLKLTVTTADGQTKTVTVTVDVKAKKGKRK
jgi:hypothetical protein